MAALAGAGYAGFWMRGLQAEAADAARIKAEATANAIIDKVASRISTDTAAAIQKIQVTNRTIYQKAVHEVETNTVYADCRLPANGVRLVNEAINSANAGGSEVPAPADTAEKR